MPSRRFFPDVRDEKIRNLENELWIARAAIVDVMPEHPGDLLRSHFQVSSRADLYEWMPWLTKEVLLAADQRFGEKMGDYPGAVHAYCPLCGRGSSGPYSRGYSFPTGLGRRLQGTHRQQQCSVMRAADRLARDGLTKEEGASVRSASARLPPWRVPKPAPPASPVQPPGPSAVVLPFRNKSTEEK